MPPTVTTEESTAVQFNQQGEIYLTQGKLEEAIASCEQALKIYPNFAPAYKTLGNALQAQGRMEEARHWYAKAIEINPNFAEVYANLGSICAQQQKWQEAIEFYQKAIALKPDFAGVYRNLAKVFGQINKPAEAQECWYRAFSLEPEKVNAGEHLKMGEAFFRQEKLPEAISCFQRAIQLDPNLATAYQNAGEALKKQGKMEEATPYYRRAIELNAAHARNGSEGQHTLAAATAAATATNGAVKQQIATAIPPQVQQQIQQIQQQIQPPVQPQVQPQIQRQQVTSGINLEDPEAYKILAEGYFAQGKLEQAIAACKKALQIKPDAGLYKMLGNALQAGGKIDEAKSCYIKAIEINPNFAEAYANYGSICAQQEQWQQAVTAYEKAIDLKPNFAGAFRNFAKLLTQLEKPEAAAEAWYRAYAIDPKSGTAEEHENLAKALIEQGKVDKGIESYRRAVALNPNAGAAYHELGEILKGKEQWEAAVEAYSNAIKNNPDLSWSHNNLAESLVKLERWEEAIAAYQKAIELNPDFSWSHNNLGDALLKLERWEEAAAAYQKATELNPDFSWSHNYLADALVKLERLEEAVEAYQRSIELNPDHFWAHNNLAETLVKLERWDEAIAAYQRANQIDPNFFWSQSKLGDALLEMERWEEAIAVYRRAAELNRDFAWTYYNLGTAFEKLERWDESIVAYRCAAEIQPDLPWLSQKLADALRMRSQWDLKDAMGLYQRAIHDNPDDIQLYHKALEIAPNDADLYVGLADALGRQGWADGAIVFYQMALQVKPGDREISARLERVLEKKNPINKQSPMNVLSAVKNTKPVTTNAIVVNESKTVQVIEQDVRLIAFYLPQFHPIPENDLWWGKGFTEWTNVSKASPLFEGHYQPHLPADLGFYDLRLPEVREAQAALAKRYGIYGFCYYYYWFAGKRLLNRPLDEVLQMKKPDFPFCICWANENWTRRWDGAEHEILMAQECWSDEQNQAFAESIVHILLDERYIRINGAPLLIVYRQDLFPNLRHTAEQWRKIFRENGVGEVHLCVAITFSGLHTSLENMGFDSAVQFPPHGFYAREILADELSVDDFSGHLYDYKDGVINSLSQEFPEVKVFRSVMTSWDNTARRKNAAHAFINSHPEIYELWLRGIIEKTRQVHSGDEKLVFINAWNEWAEGAHLEPDRKYGHSYLLATRRAWEGTHSWKTIIDILRYVPLKSSNYLHSQLDELEKRIDAMNRSIETIEILLRKTAKVIEIHRSHNSDILWQLDCPQPKLRVCVNSIDFKGWVIGKKSLAVAVKLVSNDRTLQQVPINLPRPDVAQVHSLPGSDNSGFSMTVNVTEISSDASFHLEVVLADETSILIESLRLQQWYNSIQELGMSLEQPEIMGDLHLDMVKKLLKKIRYLPIERVNELTHLLGELEKKIEGKELLLQAMTQEIKPLSVHDFYQQV